MKKRTVLAKKAIKLTVMLICLTVITTFSSCERENNHRIVGKWKCTQLSIDGTDWVNYPYDEWSIWCFKSNNTVVDGVTGTEHPYSIDGSTILIPLNNPDIDYDGIEGYVNKYEIISLTHSELILRYTLKPCVLVDGIIYDWYDWYDEDNDPDLPDYCYYKFKRI